MKRSANIDTNYQDRLVTNYEQPTMFRRIQDGKVFSESTSYNDLRVSTRESAKHEFIKAESTIRQFEPSLEARLIPIADNRKFASAYVSAFNHNKLSQVDKTRDDYIDSCRDFNICGKCHLPLELNRVRLIEYVTDNETRLMAAKLSPELKAVFNSEVFEHFDQIVKNAWNLAELTRSESKVIPQIYKRLVKAIDAERLLPVERATNDGGKGKAKARRSPVKRSARLENWFEYADIKPYWQVYALPTGKLAYRLRDGSRRRIGLQLDKTSDGMKFVGWYETLSDNSVRQLLGYCPPANFRIRDNACRCEL